MGKRRVLVDKSHLIVSWSGKARPDGRKFRLRHNKCPVHSYYVQLGYLEVVVWVV